MRHTVAEWAIPSHPPPMAARRRSEKPPETSTDTAAPTHRPAATTPLATAFSSTAIFAASAVTASVRFARDRTRSSPHTWFNP